MIEENKPNCLTEGCKTTRTGPVTSANNAESPDKKKKVPVKCDNCGKEWYEYF